MGKSVMKGKKPPAQQSVALVGVLPSPSASVGGRPVMGVHNPAPGNGAMVGGRPVGGGVAPAPRAAPAPQAVEQPATSQPGTGQEGNPGTSDGDPQILSGGTGNLLFNKGLRRSGGGSSSSVSSSLGLNR